MKFRFLDLVAQCLETSRTLELLGRWLIELYSVHTKYAYNAGSQRWDRVLKEMVEFALGCHTQKTASLVAVGLSLHQSVTYKRRQKLCIGPNLVRDWVKYFLEELQKVVKWGNVVGIVGDVALKMAMVVSKGHIEHIFLNYLRTHCWGGEKIWIMISWWSLKSMCMCSELFSQLKDHTIQLDYIPEPKTYYKPLQRIFRTVELVDEKGSENSFVLISPVERQQKCGSKKALLLSSAYARIDRIGASAFIQYI